MKAPDRFSVALSMFEQVSPELHLVWDYCRPNYLKDLTARARNRFAVASNRFAVAGKSER